MIEANTIKLPKTIAAVKEEIARRRASGEAAKDADVADYAIAPLNHGDGTISFRMIFTLTDTSTFAIDSVERFIAGDCGPVEVVEMVAVSYSPSDFKMH